MGAAQQSNGHAVGDWLRSTVPPGAHLRLDSRAVRPGDIFVALPGRRADGLQYLDQALASGAAALLVDAASWAHAHGRSAPGAPVLPVARLQDSLGDIAADYYGDASAQLRTIGITGTNGKTSSCQWIAQLLTAAGQPCAAIGTLGFGFAGAPCLEATDLTTPDAASLQRMARTALREGAKALAIEVSSIGLEQGRVNGLRFGIALFTNLSRDHLDYHPDMAAYGAAKRKLFECPSLSHAVVNLDDEFGRRLVPGLLARGLAVTGVGTRPDAGEGLALACWLHAHSIEQRPQGLRFALACARTGAVDSAIVQVSLIGAFNVANLLGVLGVALACDVSLADAAAHAASLYAPPGRLQPVCVPLDGPAPMVIVDYAHSPDAIAKALEALQPLARARSGRLCIVFGAGGDRDRGKRPVMGAVAASGAQDIVLTSDNPRSEDAESIIDEVARGIPPGVAFRRDADRAHAIEHALLAAAPSDVILIAGKGHEDYQEVAGRRLPFSDYAVARGALLARGAARP